MSILSRYFAISKGFFILKYFLTNFAKSLEKSFIIYYNIGVILINNRKN